MSDEHTLNLNINGNDVSPITAYFSLIQKITTDKSQKYVFRGQSNERYPLTSYAARKIRENLYKTDNLEFSIPIERYIHHIQFILDEFKLKGSERLINSKKFDLEILTELQHYGAATCLIDFSLSCLPPLFFACRSNADKDGAIFAINIKNVSKYTEVKCNSLSKEINYFLTQEKISFKGPIEEDDYITDNEDNEHRINNYDVIHNPTNWFWEAPHINPRIPLQQSIFLFGKPDLEYDKKIIIPHSIKKAILEDLNHCFNINNETIFPDFIGYSKVHDVINAEFNYLSIHDHIHAAVARLNSGETVDVNAIIELIKENKPTSLNFQFYDLLYIFLKLNRMNDLKNLYVNFNELYPNNPKLLLFLATICEKLGDQKERTIWIEKTEEIAKEVNDYELLQYCKQLLEEMDD